MKYEIKLDSTQIMCACVEWLGRRGKKADEASTWSLGIQDGGAFVVVVVEDCEPDLGVNSDGGHNCKGIFLTASTRFTACTATGSSAAPASTATTATTSTESCGGVAEPSVCVWLMLNPSKADHEENDPTVRRVMGFTRDWGFDQAWIVNAFALRSTDPQGLLEVDYPVGPKNDEFLRLILGQADRIVCAWGACPKAEERVPAIRGMIRDTGKQALCLGKTLSGAPKHPVRLAKTTELVAW